ncbi:SDR family NAD(P)-dependent oxidoreductase [Catenovulum adriaticum]|uniref:SDR family oxidoreductase n=1 Tax=Catenovulum adriaticum TaxID=2984846 RepID=A0ABY7AKN3_9ALTE|nr:SDR family oxidoreductase [Catenovulum sp. TS8]WAJ70113.1 SDR family oxidoreductase [Catenovulum sp. TS8]
MNYQVEQNSLHQQVALVTGGGTGIGFAIAQALVKAGAQVCITGRRQNMLEEAVAKLGNTATFYAGDITNATDRNKMVAHTRTTFDADITLLVNNAGQNIKAPALDVTQDSFDDVLNTHVKAGFALSQLVAPNMIANGQGCILFMASMASFMGVPNIIAYTTAKTAVLGLTRGLAAEWSSLGIRVNAIAPGWIHTPMTDQAFANDTQRKDKVLSRTPMNKMGEPTDIANMAVFLASSNAKFITGQCFTVDGGAAIGF